MVNKHPWFLLHPWHSPHCSKASWDLLQIDAGLAQRLTIFKRWNCLSNILLYIWTTILYPLLCQWTFRILPWLGYCKQCCNEHWGACILSDHVFLQIKKKNEIMLFAATWMDLDIIILSAVSQTKKDKYYMFSVICGIKKKLYKWTYIQNINRHRKQAYGWQKGKQGRDKLV